MHVHTRAHIVLNIFGELLFILIQYEYVNVINSVSTERSHNEPPYTQNIKGEYRKISLTNNEISDFIVNVWINVLNEQRPDCDSRFLHFALKITLIRFCWHLIWNVLCDKQQASRLSTTAELTWARPQHWFWVFFTVYFNTVDLNGVWTVHWQLWTAVVFEGI